MDRSLQHNLKTGTLVYTDEVTCISQYKQTREASILKSLDEVHRSLLGISDSKGYTFNMKCLVESNSNESLNPHDCCEKPQSSLNDSGTGLALNDSCILTGSSRSSLHKSSTKESSYNSVYQSHDDIDIVGYSHETKNSNETNTSTLPLKELCHFKTLSPVAIRALNTQYSCQTIEGKIVEKILAPTSNSKSCISINLKITKRSPLKYNTKVPTIENTPNEAIVKNEKNDEYVDSGCENGNQTTLDNCFKYTLGEESTDTARSDISFNINLNKQILCTPNDIVCKYAENQNGINTPFKEHIDVSSRPDLKLNLKTSPSSLTHKTDLKIITPVKQRSIPDYSVISPKPYSKSNNTKLEMSVKCPSKSTQVDLFSSSNYFEGFEYIIETEEQKYDEKDFLNNFEQASIEVNNELNLNACDLERKDSIEDNTIIKCGSLLGKKFAVSPKFARSTSDSNSTEENISTSSKSNVDVMSQEKNISTCSTTELKSIPEDNLFNNYITADELSNKDEFTSSTMKGQPKAMNISFKQGETASVEDSFVSYDHKQFLKVALEGNDFSDLTSTTINSGNRMPHNSTLVEKPLYNSISVSTINRSNTQEPTDCVSSIGTVDASKLISSYSGTRSPKRLGLFRALYEKARESLRVKRPGIRPRINQTTFLDGSKTYNSDIGTFYVDELFGESACEMTKRKQLLRAREECLAKEEFQDSDQQVEVERQLLLTAAKIQRLQSIMNKIDYEQNGTVNMSRSCGSLTLNDIIIPLKPFTEREFSQYYVCLLSYDRYVYATNYVTAVDFKVSFLGTKITFKNLKNNFCVKIELFCLKLRKSLRNYSHESKYNLKEDSTCPTPSVLISPTRSLLRSSRRNIVSKVNSYSESSRFCLQGSFELNFSNISPHGHYTFTGMPHSTFIQGIAEIFMTAEVYFPQECTGFLTIGEESGGFVFWNRKWCQLEGWLFKYWNYPEDQDYKYPIGCIDLRTCISPEVLPADREICSKAHTLLIETSRIRQLGDRNSLILSCKSTQTIVRNFIAADTRTDRIKWQTIFNNVVHTLRQWNTLIPDSVSK